ncbi:MAG: acyl-CoA dehydrogenase family protein [Gammaproteobacteria bacterium]|nr:acyl-CoA dehydrogenase family protein [Gammaproteobacteria bacterium]MBQ0841169.1 acyl-CoA dehydrogenase family protein [Gammaproteobacteria bacterium]
MALILNEEQNMLKESAQGFLSEHAPVAQLRQLRDERSETGYDKGTWQQMVELGWTGILVPEAHGGLEFGHVGMGQIMEENGRTLTASPLLSTAVLAASAINAAASSAQKKALLPAIVDGSLLFAVALDEGPKYRPTLVKTTVAASGEAYVLNGEKQFVGDGHIADKIIVSARTSGDASDEQGISLFIIDSSAAGVEVERVHLADSRNSAMVRLNNVELTADALLGDKGGAASVITYLADVANVHLSAELLGMSQEVFERTVQYMKERSQYGALIGSYQGLQHRAAHMFSEIELAKSVVIKALQALDENSTKLSLLASVCKAKVSEVVTLVTNEGVQLHGGIGMTDELDIGFFMKRARVAEQQFGDRRYHVQRFASLQNY